MKIRITKELPVEKEIRPKVGEVYDATIDKVTMGTSKYKIKVGKKTVKVYKWECEVVEEGKAETGAGQGKNVSERTQKEGRAEQ